MHSYDLPLSAISHLTFGSYMITHLFLLFSLFFSSTFIRQFCIHLTVCILIKWCLITMRVCPLGFHFLHYFAFLSCILFTVASFLSFFPSIHPPLDSSIISSSFFFLSFLPHLILSSFLRMVLHFFFLSFPTFFLTSFHLSLLLLSIFFLFVYYPL